METRQLEAFVTVIDTGSFTRAAARLDLSQPTVTTRVKALEQGLDTLLVDRLPSGIRPTAAGAEFLPYAREIIALTARARSAVAADGQPHGRIDIGTVAALTTYRLLPVVEYFYLRYPRVQLSMHPPACGEAITHVKDGRLDCAFLVDTVMDYPDLATKVLCREPLALVAGPDHALLDQTGVTTEQLLATALIRADTSGEYHLRFDSTLGQQPRTFELDSIDAAKRSVANGMGVALLPAIAVAQELRDGKLGLVDWTPPFETYTQIVWRRDSVNAALDALVDAVVEVVGEQTC
ncbi:LysR family transcriptional regulator [Kibdelosporangium aridum]|uniref:LysR family transcriptional regulator n=1 Tax=Kibdelosporangium aridum TaxID=2030 RepID=UPI000A04E6D9|nr:LysR family transcriptional regulator [Kibdelosporangium aridum]